MNSQKNTGNTDRFVSMPTTNRRAFVGGEIAVTSCTRSFDGGGTVSVSCTRLFDGDEIVPASHTKVFGGNEIIMVFYIIYLSDYRNLARSLQREAGVYTLSINYIYPLIIYIRACAHNILMLMRVNVHAHTTRKNESFKSVYLLFIFQCGAFVSPEATAWAVAWLRTAGFPSLPFQAALAARFLRMMKPRRKDISIHKNNFRQRLPGRISIAGRVVLHQLKSFEDTVYLFARNRFDDPVFMDIKGTVHRLNRFLRAMEPRFWKDTAELANICWLKRCRQRNKREACIRRYREPEERNRMTGNHAVPVGQLKFNGAILSSCP